MRYIMKTAAFLLIFGMLQGSYLFAQDITFQYGSIPFGKSREYILSRFPNAEIEKHNSPTAQFLSSGIIITEDLSNPVYTFFDGGIRKTVSWGDAYVDLYEELITRTDLRPAGESEIDLYFFENKLLLVHKSVRIELRYSESFDSVLGALTKRIGKEPRTGDTRFRGFSYELYAKYAFWQQQDVSIFVLVREKNFQSKRSTLEYVYIDTTLWEQYKQRVQADIKNKDNMLGDF